jgi:indolepyruvate ferredoxin oxidoreductase alpha subunit
LNDVENTKKQAAASLGALPVRPPTFCVGCPERPVFSAMKLVAQDIGRPHVSMDVGCHAFASFEPFSQGNTLLGYGMSLAAAAGVNPLSSKRAVAVMGDGGFWHNGLLSGVASNLLNKGDGVLVIMKNGYASATGTQELLSSPPEDARMVAVGQSAAGADRTIENTLTGLGVKWLRTVNNYDVGAMAKTYREAMTTPAKGLKVIVAEGECQLERQRRVRPENAKRLAKGERVVKVKYGVDEDTCTGDHSCIRLSGCPTLTVKDNPDPLRRDPVATVIDGCVGCGLCGENAHAAVLCPSFYRAEVIQNPSLLDKLLHNIA